MVVLRRAAHALLDFTCLGQASAEHFQQFAEFAPLRNRGLLAMTVLLIPLARGAPLPLAPPCNRQRPFLVLDKMDATCFMLHSQRSH